MVTTTIVADDDSLTLAKLACIYLTFDGYYVNLVHFGTSHDTIAHKPVLFSNGLKQMLVELNAWNELEAKCLKMEQIIVDSSVAGQSVYYPLRTMPIYSAMLSDIDSPLEDMMRTLIDTGQVKLIPFNDQKLELTRFEIRKNGDHVELVYTRDDHSDYRLTSNMILCMSEVIYSDRIGECDNITSLSQFYQNVNIQLPQYYSSFSVNEPQTKYKLWSSFRDPIFEKHEPYEPVEQIVKTDDDPNSRFVTSVSLVNQTAANNQIALYDQRTESNRSPRSIFSSFKPNLFLSEEAYVDMSRSTTASVAYCTKSNDGKSIAVFIPSASGKKGTHVLSNQCQYTATDMVGMFPPEFAEFFGTQRQLIQQVTDIRSVRRKDNLNMICLGNGKHGSFVHPLFQFNAFSHELYCLFTHLRNAGSWKRGLKLFDAEIDPFMDAVKQFTHQSLETPWSVSALKNIAYSSLSKTMNSILSTAANWATSNSMKVAVNLLQPSTDNLQSIHSLFGLNSQVYRDEMYARRDPFPLNLPPTLHPIVPDLKPPATSPMIMPKNVHKNAVDIPNSNRQKRVQIDRSDKQKRLQVFLRHIFPDTPNVSSGD